MKNIHKIKFYTELSYFLGVILLALGTAFMEKADFGMSMVVAPAYLLHLKISQTIPTFTFGIAEYCIQALLLIILCLIMRKFKVSYLFSFITAIFYGFILDIMIFVSSKIPEGSIFYNILYFIIGMFLCQLGVAFFFHTYIAPEVYELFVKEISQKFSLKISKVKTIYDCISCIISILLSFLFFGLFTFKGVKWGTIICALLNGFCIGKISYFLEKHFIFVNALKIKKD